MNEARTEYKIHNSTLINFTTCNTIVTCVKLIIIFYPRDRILRSYARRRRSSLEMVRPKPDHYKSRRIVTRHLTFHRDFIRRIYLC